VRGLFAAKMVASGQTFGKFRSKPVLYKQMHQDETAAQEFCATLSAQSGRLWFFNKEHRYLTC